TSSYIPLSDRGQWAGITPIPQNDGPNPLVAIMYSPEYRDAMDFFRAVSASGEKSERALELTETIIRMNPAHYTVWQYRMAILLELGKDLEVELELMNEFARENLKSYQVWHHRLLLMTHISPASPQAEIDYIHTSLLPDPKNYHTWAYLHWLFSHFHTLGRITPKMWQEEQRWCDEMLRVDGRNNSAWGWRWFLTIARPEAGGLADQGRGEIIYTLKQIHTIPHNVSAWNYLRGLLKHFSHPFSPILPALHPYLAHPDLKSLIPSPPSSSLSNLPAARDPLPGDTPLPISHAVEFLADTLVEMGRLGDAGLIFAKLGELDRMRAGYWEYRRRACAD
ncbi:putative pheromone maturation-related protein, partial [Dioszegia hungarica]